MVTSVALTIAGTASDATSAIRATMLKIALVLMIITSLWVLTEPSDIYFSP